MDDHRMVKLQSFHQKRASNALVADEASRMTDVVLNFPDRIGKHA
jgi:hypothetical protein